MAAALACGLALPGTAEAARTYLPCLEGYEVDLKFRPARCRNDADSSAAQWRLERLRWSSWGGTSAKGRGFSIPTRAYTAEEKRGRPVQVTAFRKANECGRTVRTRHYTRLRLVMPAYGGLPAFTTVVKTSPPFCWGE